MVRGENVERLLISQVFGEAFPPHLTLPSPLPPGAERVNKWSALVFSGGLSGE